MRGLYQSLFRLSKLVIVSCVSGALSFPGITCRIQNPDIPRAGRVGAPGGAAGRGQARLNANRIIRPGKKKVNRSRQGVEEPSFQRFSRSTKQRNPIYTDRGTKLAVDQRFITGLPAVYQLDEKRSLFLAANKWQNAFLFPQTLSMQGMSRNNPLIPKLEEIPRAVWVGAAHGAAAGRGGAGQDRTQTSRVAQS